MAEAEAAGRLLGDQHALRDRLAERLPHVALRRAVVSRGAAGSRRRVRRPPRGATGSASGRRAGPPAGAEGHGAHPELAAIVGGGEELLGEETGCLRSGRRSQRSRRRQGASACAASKAASSSCSSGPSSSTRAEPERRTPSASRITRAADEGSSARQVASSRTGRSSMLCARKTKRSSVDVSAQCRSSSTSSTGVSELHLCQQCQRLLEHLAAESAAARPSPCRGLLRADGGPRRTAGTAAPCRRDRSSARAVPRSRRRARGSRAPSQASSSRCPLRRR